MVLGGLQQWWLQPILMGMDATAVFFGATVMTAITDSAALTYLGSLVEGLSHKFKVALVAGATMGNGLTVIVNASIPPGWPFCTEALRKTPFIRQDCSSRPPRPRW